MGPSERKKNYDCDITYVTNSEVGLHLRDNMATSMVDVQRPFNYCVIEVDSILIDEARTADHLWAGGTTDGKVPGSSSGGSAEKEDHYEVDERLVTCFVLMKALPAEQLLEVKDLYDPNDPGRTIFSMRLKQRTVSRGLYRP